MDFSGQVAWGLAELLGVEAEGLVHVELRTIHRWRNVLLVIADWRFSDNDEPMIFDT